MRHIALKVPLSALAFARGGQCRDAANARVETLGNPLNDAALASRIPTFKQNNNLALVVRNPVLQLHKFALKSEQFFEVEAPVQCIPVRMLGDVIEELVQSIVINLHFELFVEAVSQLLSDALVQRRSLCRSVYSHKILHQRSLHGTLSTAG